jgi:aspartyl-tRNA(Asn)/glutamyl-tRNA(Gln) amidotransferase subunit C
MSLTRADVERISLLARLQLDSAELDQLTEQLGQIVGYIEKLSELDTDQIEPLAHTQDLTNVIRPDEQSAGLTRDAALANAPQRDEECFRVPAVLGD